MIEFVEELHADVLKQLIKCGAVSGGQLAMRLGLPLATMDKQLADAATRAGIAIFLQQGKPTAK